MRWSARVSISRCTARPFTDEIRLGRRPGTALAVEGSQRKLGPLTFGSSLAGMTRPMVNRALTSGPLANPGPSRPVLLYLSFLASDTRPVLACTDLCYRVG